MSDHHDNLGMTLSQKMWTDVYRRETHINKISVNSPEQQSFTNTNWASQSNGGIQYHEINIFGFLPQTLTDTFVFCFHFHA